MSKFFELLDKFPTTRFRILVTTLLIIITVIKWLIYACLSKDAAGACIGWHPSDNMLIFLAAMAGIDVAQYATRRRLEPTVKSVDNSLGQSATAEVDSTSTTDISELNNKG